MSGTESELRRLRQHIGELKDCLSRLRKGQTAAAGQEFQQGDFCAVLEAIPIPVAVTRVADGMVLFVNRHVATLFKKPPETLLGRLTDEFTLDPDLRLRTQGLVEQEGRATGILAESRRDDGSPLWLSWSVEPIRFNGEDCYLNSVVDITEERLSQQRLRDDREMLRRLLDLCERERRWAAFEIHDGAVQDMTGALMFIESALHAAGQQTPGLTPQLEKAARFLRRGIDEARRLINGMLPPVLADEGLVGALANLVDEVAATVDLRLAFQHEGEFERLAPSLEMTIYRIVQESLSNIRKHSQAESANVRLRERNGSIEIEVVDHGVGFDVTKVHEKQYGLTSVRERAELLDGSVTIESVPGQGARVFVTLPIRYDDAC